MPVKPIRPGTVIGFTGEAIPVVLPSLAGTVLVPIIHDWGPEGLPPSNNLPFTPGLGDLAEFDILYGSSDTAGRRAALMAFKGQGTESGGAGNVIPYRLVGAAGAFATVAITNTTPATALTLTAKYKGTRGNRLSYQTLDDPRNAANDILRLFLDGVKQEEYVYANGDINGLRDQINVSSKLVTAVANVNAVALTVSNPVTNPALAGGNDGTSNIVAGTWTTMMAAVEFERFSIIAPYDLTDPTIRASLVAWIQGLAAANRPVTLIVGGDAADTITTSISRASAINDPHVITIGIGTYYDTQLARVLSTSELAPRVAGVLAARGESKALTFAKLAGLQAGKNGATGAPDGSQIESAIQNGVTVFSRAIAPDAELHVEMGKTTFTTRNNVALPYDVFSDPRLVRIMDLYVRRMKEWGDEELIGEGPVNEDARTTLYGQARKEQDRLLEAGLILPEDLTSIPPVQAPFVNVIKTNDDTLPYQFGWQFARTTNYVLGDGRVR